MELIALKMKYKLMIIMLAMLLVLPVIAAQPYPLYEDISLKVPFEVNGSTPSASASCNVSIIYPNSSYLVSSGVMNNIGTGNFDYTIGLSKVSEIGEYQWTAFCCDGVKCAAGNGNFDVTPTGFLDTLGFIFIVLILSLGVMAFGFYLRDAPIVLLSSFGLYFVSIYILNFGIDGLKDPVYTWAIGLIILGLAMYISIKSAYELVTSAA